MSCTSKRKCESGGMPLLPGSKEWQKFKISLDEYKKTMAEMQCAVDDKPPKLNIFQQLDHQKMRQAEQKKLEIEMKNRFLLNLLSNIYQSPSDTATTHSRKFHFRSSKFSQGKMALIKQGKENMRLALTNHRIESDYDHISQAEQWISNRRTYVNLRRYKPNKWKPVFEKRAEVQAKRGRELDPYYSFRF